MENADKTKLENVDVKPVFPLFSSENEVTTTSNRHHSLFPSAVNYGRTQNSSLPQNKEVDWLENKSFTSVTAQKLVELQEELKQLQAQERNDGKDVKDKDVSTGGHTSYFISDAERKRTGSQLNDSSSDSDTEDVRRRKQKTRHKNGKEKHKQYSDTEMYAGEKEHKKKRVKKEKKEKKYEKAGEEYSSSDNSDIEARSHKKKKKIYYASSDESERKRSHKKKKKKHKHKTDEKKRKHTKDDRKYEDVPGQFQSTKHFQEELEGILPEHAFKLDRTADQNSWTYGSLYKQHVARYKLHYNNCMGSHGQSYSNPIVKKTKPSSERYFGKENRKFIQQTPVEKIVMKDSKLFQDKFILNHSKEVTITAQQAAFIKIESSNGENESSSNINIRDRIMDSSTNQYVRGKGKVEGKDASMADEPVENVFNSARLKVAEFNRQLRERPNEIKLWLELVKFQDSEEIEQETVGSENDVSQSVKNHSISSRAALDKKLSILDKALECNPGNIELLLVKMELKSVIQDAMEIAKELEQLLFIHPANTELWRYYLTFNQSRLSVFSVSKVTKNYQKCFKTLFGISEGQLQTHSVPENLNQEIVKLFLQYCQFLKQAGHNERAMASLQAILEYNMFCPSHLVDVSRETKMVAFEEFWDSNCARVGESGAKGWQIWDVCKDADQDNAGPEEGLEEIEEATIEKKLPKCDTWLHLETLREGHHWMPWKPDLSKGQTEEDCEDVERLVLFDDVSPILFDIPQNLWYKVVITVLALETDITMATNEASDLYSDLYLDHMQDLSKHFPNNSQDELGLNNSIENKSKTNFVINFLSQMATKFSGKERSDLTLILIKAKLKPFHEQTTVLSKSDKKEMRKIVKNVLKEESFRNDLFIWGEYINLEREIGKPGEAESIIETALAMHSGRSLESCTDHQTVGLISLFNLYAEMLLKMENNTDNPGRLLDRMAPFTMETKHKVMSTLGYLVESRPFNPKTFENMSSFAFFRIPLKFCTLLESCFEKMCAANEFSSMYYRRLCWCYCLFTYCNSGLQICINLYTQVIMRIQKQNSLTFSQFERTLYSDQLRIILYHMATATAPLGSLRECLDSALKRFPHDPTFLALFVGVEKKSRITGRLNKCFDRWSRVASSPMPVVFAVTTQMDFLTILTEERDYVTEHGVINSGLVHRTRVWLERTVSQSKLQHCPLVWRIYLQFERQVGSTDRQKGVFYRALQQCPWVKSLYMDGIRLFGLDQLQEMVDLMTEKELRVHLPIEELDILIGP